MKQKKTSDIFGWAWERRQKDQLPPDEPRYTISEALKILQKYSESNATEKKLRDYERNGVVKPERTEGGHRFYSISNILCLHLMLQGTKCFGKADTIPIVKLYEISRRQPKRFDPVIFDYDPQLPGEKQIHKLLHEPVLKSSFHQISKLLRIVHKVDDFLHINEFARENGIGFVCHDRELLKVRRAGIEIKIAPPLTEWESVKKARDWMRFYIAEARVKGKLPIRKNKSIYQAFENKIQKMTIGWLLKNGYAVRLDRKSN